MTHDEQHCENCKVIYHAARRVGVCYSHAPSYQAVVATLNTNGLRTSRGNAWTEQRLRRMLQRNGISGIWGLTQGQHK